MADLNRPKIVIPSGCKGGAFVVGTAADVLVHTCVSGEDELDAVTVSGAATAGQTLLIKVPSTAGGQASIPVLVVGNEAPLVVELPPMNQGAEVYVNGAATAVFGIGVLRYPAGKGDATA